MSETSMFFNGYQTEDGYDREYDSNDLSKYFSDFISNGVYLDNSGDALSVNAKSGMTVTIKKGKAFILGHRYELTEDMDITLSPNTASVTRYTLVTCRLSMQDRSIKINVRQNVTDITPVRTENEYELVLATIEMRSGVTSISRSFVTDRRLDSSYCGAVMGVIQQINIGEVYEQFKSQFSDWFDGIKGHLSTDQAGNLQNQINDLSELFNSEDFVKNNVTVTKMLKIGEQAVTQDANTKEVIFSGKIKSANISDSGWQKATLKSGIEKYRDGEAYALKYRKINGVVYVQGTFIITNKKANTQAQIFDLPTGYRPKIFTGNMCNASSSRIAKLSVTTGGSVIIEWVRDMIGGAEVTGNTNWIAINTCFVAD